MSRGFSAPTSYSRDDDNYITLGFVISAIGHGIVAIVAVFGIFPNWGQLPEPVVYSISLEGGKTLGGMAQVPKDDKPSQVAPAKNVSASEPKQEQKQPEKVEEKPKEEKKVEPAEDAEVQIKTEKKEPEKKKEEPKKEEPKKEEKKEEPKKLAKEEPKKKEDKKKESPNQAEDLNKKYQNAMQRYLGESSDAGGQGFGAAKLGGNKMGGGVVRPPEFFLYEKIIRSKIKEAWRWFDTSAALMTQISFDIERDGTVKNVAIVRGSGNSEFDDSVVRAIKKASPLPQPPASVYEQYFRSVRITFDPRE